MSAQQPILRAGNSKAMRAVRDEARFRAWTDAPKSNAAAVADVWLDALTAIQRRGTCGTIRQALDDIEAAFERSDAIEAAERARDEAQRQPSSSQAA